MKNMKRVAEGLYRYAPTGQLYERVRWEGKDTFQKLPATTLIEARKLRAERTARHGQSILGIAGAVSPYERTTLNTRDRLKTVGEVIDTYRGAGCPDRARQPRTGKALDQDASRLKILEAFWASIKVTEVRVRTCDDYADWRKKQKFNGKKTRGRAIDLELNTLNNALLWTYRRELIDINPLGEKRPRYGPRERDVRHCYQTAPTSGDELHDLARFFFTENSRSEVLGWQVLFDAMTGLRRGEAIQMRWDATQRGQLGFIEGWKYLHVPREKNGVSPWVEIHPALRTLLEQMKAWRDLRFPDSPWFFPSPFGEGREHVHADALTKAIARAGQAVSGAERTTHGLRAYYVTVRRSQGIPDNIIACEIGHTTGGSTLAKAYGGVPRNWYMIDHPELSWMPGPATAGHDAKRPAWEEFAAEGTVFSIPQVSEEEARKVVPLFA